MNLITTLLNNLNYPTIFFLMLLESTVVPVPSEFVVTPAAYHAAGGSLNVFLIILFATIGADVGASINYFAALYVGRPVIYRFANSRLGRLCLLNQEKIEKSEKYFDEYLIYLKMACENNPHEAKQVMGHLFPENFQPKDYYEYARKQLAL